MEENLEGEIDFEEASRIACCSLFHFQRMFSYIASVPLSEYIRRRRMTKAAFELQNSDIKIIDLALKYGYESPTSFSRAFQSIHEIAPSNARGQGVKLKAYPPMTFSISIKGDVEMNYKIEKKEPFRIVGVKKHMEISDENFAQVPQFWGETIQSGMFGKVCMLAGREDYSVLGVCASMNNKDFDYYIACESGQPVPEGMCEFTVPASTYAIFECVGPMPTAIQELQTRVLKEWLPSSGYEYADAPDIEVYPAGDPQSENYRTEVWLPVVKRRND